MDSITLAKLIACAESELKKRELGLPAQDGSRQDELGEMPARDCLYAANCRGLERVGKRAFPKIEIVRLITSLKPA